MKEHPDKQESKNPILEKISNYAGVMSGTASTVVGVASGDPMAAMSGAVTFFSNFITPFMQKNRDKFLDDLKTDFEKLESKFDLKIDSALSNEKVLSAILESYPTALREYRDEKRELLRNAILNIALDIDIADDLRSMYFKLVDEFTPTHILILSLLEDPEGFVEKYNIDPEAISSQSRISSIPEVFPQIKGTFPMFLKSLEDSQLIMKNEQLIFKTKNNSNANLTVYGLNFMHFISSPFSK